ncbi:pectin lyase-like [Belonocnema kinseyi]|uniref:pectin lyase-like n=1 Tax=Belonocnema kinseyi TaxID=2817044 RepID=UPI00143DFF3D|nr:pectin lyase-like [Belonocnema kinseyi]
MQIAFLLILAFFAAVAAVDYYPNTKLRGMSGFAQKGRTTGGSTGPVIYVNNLEDLKQHISNPASQTLLITTNIHSPKKVRLLLGANKSIIGSWKANIINNVYFETTPSKSSNIIFQNLIFLHNVENIDNSDTQLILDHGERYWIDHCTFDGKNVNEKDLGKLLKVSTVNFVTISYCKFVNHFYGLILGYPSDDPADIAMNNNYPRLTIMFNYFENINARAPGLMRFGKFHVYNNYINNCRLGFTIGTQCKIFSENNYFTEASKDVLDDKGTGFFKDAGSINMPLRQNSKVDKWRPSSDYHYSVKTPDYSRDFCTQFSGAQSQKLHFVPDHKKCY